MNQYMNVQQVSLHEQSALVVERPILVDCMWQDLTGILRRKVHERADNDYRRLEFPTPEGYDVLIIERVLGSTGVKLMLKVHLNANIDTDVGIVSYHYESPFQALVSGLSAGLFDVRYGEDGASYLVDRCSSFLSLDRAAERLLDAFDSPIA